MDSNLVAALASGSVQDHLETKVPAPWSAEASRAIFAFFIVNHGTREVVHFNVTRGPTDVWVTQQLREATPWGGGPKYLIRDDDDKFGRAFDAIAQGTGIEVVKIPPSSANLNPICERFLGGPYHDYPLAALAPCHPDPMPRWMARVARRTLSVIMIIINRYALEHSDRFSVPGQPSIYRQKLQRFG